MVRQRFRKLLLLHGDGVRFLSSPPRSAFGYAWRSRAEAEGEACPAKPRAKTGRVLVLLQFVICTDGTAIAVDGAQALGRLRDGAVVSRKVPYKLQVVGRICTFSATN